MDLISVNDKNSHLHRLTNNPARTISLEKPMHYARPLSALLLGLFLAGHSLASERYEHFKGQPSENLPQALHNLAEYNQKLQALLAKPAFDEHDLHEVHALTYTLENALGRID